MIASHLDQPGGPEDDASATPDSAGVPPDRRIIGAIDRFDRWADERVADRLRGRATADRLFYAASALGDHGLVWLILADLQALARADRWPDWLRTSGALGVESIVVNGPIKWAFRRPRPVRHTPASLPLRVPITSSFPSGHATSAFCAAALLTEADPDHRCLYYGLAVIVAWSRVHVRLHHASDVLGGAAIGAVLGMAAKRLVRLVPRESGAARRG